MYEKIKQLVKYFLPIKLIKSNEDFLRRIISMGYVGRKYECNICGFKMSKFIQLNNGELLCPRCASLPRTRKLWSLIEMEIEGKTLLHFSPPKSIVKCIIKSNVKEYITTDYEGEFDATKHLNITDIDEPDEKYDLIICYHLLEHIEEDQMAMKELYRILKPNGTCFIQTPFKEGEIYENNFIKTESKRLLHFGQKDHVRIYSVNGLKERLIDTGFKTKIIINNENPNNKFGFKEHETVFILKKN